MKGEGRKGEEGEREEKSIGRMEEKRTIDREDGEGDIRDEQREQKEREEKYEGGRSRGNSGGGSEEDI